MDNVSKKKRSRIMAANKPKDTKPEKAVRSILYALGYRFRKNVKGLPGTPDIVVLGCDTVVFVHGCFWHAHGCGRSSTPKSNVAFWRKKMADNKKRDARNADELAAAGWKVLVIWECQLSSPAKIRKFFIKELKRKEKRERICHEGKREEKKKPHRRKSSKRRGAEGR